MSLLPSKPDAPASEDAEPRVVDVDSAEADEVISALSSETARDILAAVHDDPAPPSDLADRVDTTLQNAQYHLGNLEEAGAVEVVDTAYSEKGREMDVYAPADQPLVIFAGDDDESVLRTALSRLLGAVALLAVASFAVQQLFGVGGLFGTEPTGGTEGGDAASAPAAGNETTPTPAGGADESTNLSTTYDSGSETDATAEMTEEAARETVADATETAANLTETPTPTETVDPETTTATADATREVAAGLPPGLLFFLGGLFVLALVAGLLYLRS